ncbi:hypothetical protein SAMN05216389_11240 [Oceanobacillus limi]|uniref:Uncharacterized protein n=1 Tax=Oceanobacillus limi TaxID=930131 RepID=A0A1I0EQY0_9BACI|nr:hypothetical protein [Oceanobacillus limi]SET47462.1 hypothetical protein SAMN05216389_11240 [Oceanobacillus limi]
MQLKTIRYWILFGSFSILFGFGTWLVELIEGSKITTSEHIDFGIFLIFYGCIGGSFLFGVIMLPLTIIMERFFNKLVIKMIVYSIVGYYFGKFVFGVNFHGEHVQIYHLTEVTSILIFMGIGLLYAWIDRCSYHKLILN